MIEIKEGFHTIELEGTNELSYHAIVGASRFMDGRGYEREVRQLNKLFSWGDSSSPWRQWIADHTIEGVRYQGKWPTRFQKFWRTKGEEVSITGLSMLGEYLSAQLIQSKTLYFEIAKYADWPHGAFEGKVSSDGSAPGACWWNKFALTRTGMVIDKRGWSILFYASEEDAKKNRHIKGVGRCWMFEFDDGPIIFNAYGPSLPEIANALSKLWGVKHHKVILKANPELAYINAGMRDNEGRGGGGKGYGFLLGEKKTFSEYDLPDVRHRDVKCRNCETPLISADAYTVKKNEYVCGECLQNYKQCSVCSKYTDDYQRVKINGYNSLRVVCNPCYDNLEECHFCGKTVHPTYPVWHTSFRVCESCVAHQRASRCDDCHRFTITPIIIHLYDRDLKLCKTHAHKLKERLP